MVLRLDQGIRECRRDRLGAAGGGAAVTLRMQLDSGAQTRRKPLALFNRKKRKLNANEEEAQVQTEGGYVPVYACMCVLVYACMCVCVCACICMHACVCVC